MAAKTVFQVVGELVSTIESAKIVRNEAMEVLSSKAPTTYKKVALHSYQSATEAMISARKSLGARIAEKALSSGSELHEALSSFFPSATSINSAELSEAIDARLLNDAEVAKFMKLAEAVSAKNTI